MLGEEEGIAMRYAIAVEDAGTNFAAYVPDLPGCIATACNEVATGGTFEELVHDHENQLHVRRISRASRCTWKERGSSIE